MKNQMKNQLKIIKLLLPIILIAFSVLVLFSPGLFAEDKEKGSNSLSIFSNTNRPLPDFDHELHEDALEDGGCAKCHHVLDEDTDELVYSEGEETACSDCHFEQAEDDLLAMREANHAICTRCHRDLKKEKKKAGPTSCGECHKKQE